MDAFGELGRKDEECAGRSATRCGDANGWHRGKDGPPTEIKHHAARARKTLGGSGGQGRGQNACDDACADACAIDLHGPPAIDTTRFSIRDLLRRSDRAEVEDAARPEAGTEPESSLEITGRRDGGRYRDKEARDGWRIEHHEARQAARPPLRARRARNDRRRAISAGPMLQAPGWYVASVERDRLEGRVAVARSSAALVASSSVVMVDGWYRDSIGRLGALWGDRAHSRTRAADPGVLRRRLQVHR